MMLSNCNDYINDLKITDLNLHPQPNCPFFKILLDLAKSIVVDQSALKAIEDIASKYSQLEKQVKLRHLSRDCHSLLSRTGQLIVESDYDPDYGVTEDYNVKLGIINS